MKKVTRVKKCNQRSGLRSRSRSNICRRGRLSMGRYGLAAWVRWGSGALQRELVHENPQNNSRIVATYVDRLNASRPRVREVPRRCPRRILSSLGKEGKNRGGGGWPGKERWCRLGSADVNALRLCAYARSLGYVESALFKLHYHITPRVFQRKVIGLQCLDAS